MKKTFSAVAILLALGVPAAHGNPDVWVKAGATYSFEDRHVTGLSFEWEFDEYFSSRTLRTYDANQSGTLEPEEVEQLREEVFDPLRKFDYYVHIWGRRRRSAKPRSIDEFSASIKDRKLVYRFTVALTPPADPGAQRDRCQLVRRERISRRFSLLRGEFPSGGRCDGTRAASSGSPGARGPSPVIPGPLPSRAEVSHDGNPGAVAAFAQGSCLSLGASCGWRWSSRFSSRAWPSHRPHAQTGAAAPAPSVEIVEDEDVGIFVRFTDAVIEFQRRANAEIATHMNAIERGESLAAFSLALFIAFAYGMVHALGPGHGKFIIISYFMGRDVRVTRGDHHGGPGCHRPCDCGRDHRLAGRLRSQGGVRNRTLGRSRRARREAS